MSQFKGIQVTGTGKISLPPNVAYITGGVVTQNTKVSKAVRDNSEKMREVLASLKEAGVTDKEVTTTSLQITPQWQQATKTKKAGITGYMARNGVTIKLKDMEKVGDVIDALSEAANEIEDLSFAAEYPEKEAEALALAMDSAKARATKIAYASGIELGQLVSCQESSRRNTPHRARAQSMSSQSMCADAGGGMPVASGDIDLTVTVQVVYAVPKQKKGA